MVDQKVKKNQSLDLQKIQFLDFKNVGDNGNIKRVDYNYNGFQNNIIW